MTTKAHGTAQLGDLVVAAFDTAALYSADPRLVSRLATRAIARLLQRHREARSASGLTGASSKGNRGLALAFSVQAALICAAFLVASPARAAEGDPLPAQPGSFSLKVEPGVAFPLTDPQSRLFGVGGGQAVKALWSLNRYLDLGPSLAYMALPAQESPSAAGTAWAFGGSLRLQRPHDVPGDSLHAVSPWLDVDALYIRTGPLNRPGFAVAAGLSFPIGKSRSFWIGPFVRYFQIVQIDQPGYNNNDSGNLIVGVSLEVGSGVEREHEAEPAAKAPATTCPPCADITSCPDRDGDGVPDSVDLCPDAPGPWVSHGCPVYNRVIVKPDRLELKEKIQFQWNSPVIETVSHPVLDEVARALQDNRSFRVQIEGNSSSEGGDERNQILSEQRAKAVLDYLADRGVARDRLTWKGFGSDRPLTSNATEEGRETNRRVEFVVQLTILNNGSK